MLQHLRRVLEPFGLERGVSRGQERAHGDVADVGITILSEGRERSVRRIDRVVCVGKLRHDRAST